MTTFIAADASRSALDAYFRDLARLPPLTPEEETNLARAAIAGDPEVREKLISCNLRFVVMVAKRYQFLGLPLEDLISEGNRGILRALKKFDPETTGGAPCGGSGAQVHARSCPSAESRLRRQRA